MRLHYLLFLFFTFGHSLLVHAEEPGETSSFKNEKELSRFFIENLGKVDSIRKMFPSQAAVASILKCDAENPLWADVNSQLQILNESGDAFKTIKTEYLRAQVVDKKSFNKGDKNGDCTFQRSMDIINLEVHAKFSQADLSKEDSDLIQVIKAGSEYYLLSL